MGALRAYAGVSVVIGLLQVADGLILLLREAVTVNWYLAAIEFLWVPVSAAMTVVALVHRNRWWIPASYVLYNMLGWGYGLYLVYSLLADETTDFLSTKAVVAGLLFGLYFAGVNAWSYRTPEARR